MGSSSDNFESLQKLLRLKRYEQPPPRYFREFSSRVIARIEAGEARGQAAWWERFGIDLRPVLTAGVGMLACGLVVFGLVFAVDADSQGFAQNAGMIAPLLGAGVSVSQDPAADAVELVGVTSTNPISPFNAGFSSPHRSSIMPVSYQFR